MSAPNEYPWSPGNPCWACDGVFVSAFDDLGCEYSRCSNYPETCDEAVYTYEQAMANTRAYAAANPEWRAAFIARTGREPGVIPPDARRANIVVGDLNVEDELSR